MVGYDPGNQELPHYVYSLAGACSGIVTRAVGQPLDVLKIRFQIQIKLSDQSPANQVKYRGVFQACGAIYREEGARAFWKGHVPAQALSVVYGVVQFGTFEALTKHAYKQLPPVFTSELRPVTHFLCGGVSGCLATLLSMPLDVIRTRFVAQGEPKVYKSVSHASRLMLAEEGARSFFRGLAPTLVQIAPQSGFQFGFYSLFNMLWKTVFNQNGIEPTSSEEKPRKGVGNLQSLLCGSAAGLCSKTLVYPLDLAKKRLQMQGFERGWLMHSAHTRCYAGLRHCLHTIILEEGARGLFRGLAPSLLKGVVTTAISFWGYEQSVRVFSGVYKVTR